MNNREKFYKTKDVSCREEPPEGAVLFFESENKVLILNNMGLLVWKTIRDRMSRQEIARAFHSNFGDVDFETVLNDVVEYIDLLYGKGFLQLEENE